MRRVQIVLVMCVYVLMLCCWSESTGELLAQTQRTQIRGPHVCGSKRDRCCFGWKLNPLHGLCTTAVCRSGCGEGVCSRPDACWCPGRYFSRSCDHSNLTSTSTTPTPEPTIQRSARIHNRQGSPPRRQNDVGQTSSQRSANHHQRFSYRQWVSRRMRHSSRRRFRHPSLWTIHRKPVVSSSSTGRHFGKVESMDPATGTENLPYRRPDKSFRNNSDVRMSQENREMGSENRTTVIGSRQDVKRNEFNNSKNDNTKMPEFHTGARTGIRDGSRKQPHPLPNGVSKNSHRDNRNERVTTKTERLSGNRQYSRRLSPASETQSESGLRNEFQSDAPANEATNTNTASLEPEDKLTKKSSSMENGKPDAGDNISNKTRGSSDNGTPMEEMSQRRFKARVSENLRSQLSDPRIRTLLRALGARKRRKPNPPTVRTRPKSATNPATQPSTVSTRDKGVNRLNRKPGSPTVRSRPKSDTMPPMQPSTVSTRDGGGNNQPISRRTNSKPTVKVTNDFSSRNQGVSPTPLAVGRDSAEGDTTGSTRNKDANNKPISHSANSEHARKEPKVFSPQNQVEVSTAQRAIGGDSAEVYITQKELPETRGENLAQRDSSYVDDTTQSSSLGKDHIRSLFPGHQIIDLNVRYRKRIPSIPKFQIPGLNPITQENVAASTADISEVAPAIGTQRPTQQTVFARADSTATTTTATTPASQSSMLSSESVLEEVYRPGVVDHERPFLETDRSQTDSSLPVEKENPNFKESESRTVVEEVYGPVKTDSNNQASSEGIPTPKHEGHTLSEDTSLQAASDKPKTLHVNLEFLGKPTTETKEGCRDDQCRDSSLDATPETVPGGLRDKDLNPRPLEPLEVECPPGHRRALRNGYIVCEALRATFANMTEDQLCGPGQELVSMPGGRADCVQAVPGPRACGEGEVLSEEGGRRVCKPVTTVSACPEGQIAVFFENGFQCQYITETTTTTTTTTRHTPQPRPRCPDGQRELHTDTGPLCLPEFFATTVAGHVCPDGMTSIETSVGVFCLFVGDFVVSKSLSIPTTDTPDTSTPERLDCSEGMVVIQTSSGEVCGFEAGPPRGVQCPEDQVLVEGSAGYECRPLHLITDKTGPCPAGQELTRTESGVVCQYRKSDRPVDIRGYFDCTDNQILTQTSSGFFCQDLDLGVIGGHGADVIPLCTPGNLAVKLKSGDVTCLSQGEATLRCPKGMELKRTSVGFFCQRKGIDLRKKCAKGEVLLVDGERTLCQRLEKNGHLCGEGYKPQMSQDGFVCKVDTVPLSCPSDFYLAADSGESRGGCRPSEPNVNVCHDQQFRKIFGDRVVCQEGDLSGVLVPCDDGYHVTDSDAGPLCQLDDYVTVLCHEEQEDDVITCIVQPARGCKDDFSNDEASTGRKKGCREVRLEALSGCKPRCANGGRCEDGKCVCPPGLHGNACQIDMDECQKLPQDFCQHGCLNTFGSFRCVCPQRATLNADGRTCQYAECVPRCMNRGRCEKGRCICPPGFAGTFCQDDVDECRTGKSLCQHQCLNTLGSFMCVCRPGSRLAPDGRSCINTTCVPECRHGGRCENQRCTCSPGFTGFVCQLDVNECRSRQHGCSHKCTNTYGSFRCSCPRDHVLEDDGKTCAPVRSRRLPNTKKSSPAGV